MKVVTQGDSQVCYYGSMKKKGRGQRETSSFVFAKQGEVSRYFRDPPPMRGWRGAQNHLKNLKKSSDFLPLLK